MNTFDRVLNLTNPEDLELFIQIKSQMPPEKPFTQAEFQIMMKAHMEEKTARIIAEAKARNEAKNV